MKPDLIHNQLLNAIKDKIPSNDLVNHLMNILCIGKEAVYRRLRGDVFFTFEEVATIGFTLGISIDNIIGIYGHPKSHPFQLKTTSFVDPSSSDYYQMYEWLDILRKIVQSPVMEMGETGNIFDMSLLYPYPYLCSFYHFKWQYQWRSKERSKCFGEIKIPEEHRKLQLESSKLFKEIKKNYYIWDYMIFQYIVSDVSYFKDMCLINNNDVLHIKEDMLKLVDYLELITEEGCYETGNLVEIYISNINSDATYTYYQCEYFNLAMVKAFTLNSLTTIDKTTTNQIKEWILSQKRQATLISESNKMQRVVFFEKQRKIIDTIT